MVRGEQRWKRNDRPLTLQGTDAQVRGKGIAEDREVLENVNQIRANARKVFAYHFLQLLQSYVVADHLAGQCERGRMEGLLWLDEPHAVGKRALSH